MGVDDIISEFWWRNLIHYEELKSYFVENRWTAPNSKLLRPTWQASILLDVWFDLDVTLAELVWPSESGHEIEMQVGTLVPKNSDVQVAYTWCVYHLRFQRGNNGEKKLCRMLPSNQQAVLLPCSVLLLAGLSV